MNPVVLIASINAALNHASPNLIKDWLPSITAIVVVIIGGILTYLSTIRIEEQKRQYELKKDVYFNIMGVIVDFRSENETYNELYNSSKKLTGDPTVPLDRIKRIKDLLKLLEMKMKISTGEDINCIFGDVIRKAQNVEDYQAFNDAVFNQLIPAIKDDLMKNQKHWWQFLIK